MHLNILGNFPRHAETLLQVVKSVEQVFSTPFIDEMAIDQTVFFHARFDPVAFEKVVAFDEIRVLFGQKLLDIFRGFDRHAIARQHVEMRGLREGIQRGTHRAQRGLDQRPFAPTALHTTLHQNHVWIVRQLRLDLAKACRIRAFVIVDGNAITSCGETRGLFHNSRRVFVTKQNKCNFCHGRNPCPVYRLIIILNAQYIKTSDLRNLFFTLPGFALKIITKY